LIADGRLAFEFDGKNDSGGDDYSPAYHSDYTTINFGRNPQVATLMHTTKWNFFEVLQKKLHWNTEV
jgi:NAD kinase